MFITSISASPVSLELNDGSVLKGEITSQTADRIQLTTDFGVIGLSMDKISEKSRILLISLISNDPVALQQRILEQQKIIEALRAEIAILRNQDSSISSPVSPSPRSPQSFNQVVSTPPSPPQNQSGDYWMSSTGKRHNKRCRYYGTGAGHTCGQNDGVPCKICGG